MKATWGCFIGSSPTVLFCSFSCSLNVDFCNYGLMQIYTNCWLVGDISSPFLYTLSLLIQEFVCFLSPKKKTVYEDIVFTL